MGNKLLAGLQLLVFGMGMVYAFLILMILCMKLMSKIIAPIVARQKAVEQVKNKSASAASADDAALAAAAVAAVATARR